MPSNLVLAVVSYTEAISAIRAIRQTVFQTEQGVEAALDFDGFDETASHLLAYWQHQPIGTARIRMLNDRLAKLERVAVLPAYRGLGVGKALVEAAIAFLDQQEIPEIKLNAQIQTKTFYEKLGFEPRGAEFEEAGIIHIAMYRSKNKI